VAVHTDVTEYGRISVITVRNELTGESVETFRQSAARCVDEHRYEMIVDCSSLSQIDSAGLEALVDLLNSCEGELGTVKLCGADETIRKILELTRLSRRFEVFDDLDAAVKSFS